MVEVQPLLFSFFPSCIHTGEVQPLSVFFFPRIHSYRDEVQPPTLELYLIWTRHILYRREKG